jgi:hypothetical protein
VGRIADEYLSMMTQQSKMIRATSTLQSGLHVSHKHRQRGAREARMQCKSQVGKLVNGEGRPIADRRSNAGAKLHAASGLCERDLADARERASAAATVR